MEITLWNIFLTFFKVGAILLGGGYVIYPILQAEVIDKSNWITIDELTDFYALSQSLPGIVAANISIFIGYKLRGKSGALASLLGIIAAPFLTIILIALVFSHISDFPLIRSLLWGVAIAVVILLYLSVKEMWVHSVVDRFSALLFSTIFLIALFYDVSPVILIIGALIIGVTQKILEKRRA